MPCRTEIVGGGSDRCTAGCPDPRGGRAHLRARPPRRCCPTGAPRSSRSSTWSGATPCAAWPRSGLAIVPERRARPAGALQPGEAEPGPRPDLARRTGDPLQAGGDVRRVPHQQAPQRAPEAEDRRRRDPGPQSRHHLRARHGSGRARPGRRQGLLRLPGLLGPLRHRGRAPSAPSTTSCRSRRPRVSATRSGP